MPDARFLGENRCQGEYQKPLDIGLLYGRRLERNEQALSNDTETSRATAALGFHLQMGQLMAPLLADNWVNARP